MHTERNRGCWRLAHLGLEKFLPGKITLPSLHWDGCGRGDTTSEISGNLPLNGSYMLGCNRKSANGTWLPFVNKQNQNCSCYDVTFARCPFFVLSIYLCSQQVYHLAVHLSSLPPPRPCTCFVNKMVKLHSREIHVLGGNRFFSLTFLLSVSPDEQLQVIAGSVCADTKHMEGAYTVKSVKEFFSWVQQTAF